MPAPSLILCLSQLRGGARTLHYITLHYITLLHYATLHYIGAVGEPCACDALCLVTCDAFFLVVCDAPSFENSPSRQTLCGDCACRSTLAVAPCERLSKLGEPSSEPARVERLSPWRGANGYCARRCSGRIVLAVAPCELLLSSETLLRLRPIPLAGKQGAAARPRKSEQQTEPAHPTHPPVQYPCKQPGRSGAPRRNERTQLTRPPPLAMQQRASGAIEWWTPSAAARRVSWQPSRASAAYGSYRADAQPA